jgi:hypothetical protein
MTVGTSTHGSRQEGRKPNICPYPSGISEKKLKLEREGNIRTINIKN